MDPHPLANLFKGSNYDEPTPSDLDALDYLYKLLPEIRKSENRDEQASKLTHEQTKGKGKKRRRLGNRGRIKRQG